LADPAPEKRRARSDSQRAFGACPLDTGAANGQKRGGMSTENQPPRQAPIFIWWILWAGIGIGLVAMYLVLGRHEAPTSDRLPSVSPYVLAVPLLLSCVVRWLVLPRMPTRRKAFPIFIIGLALAEGAGQLGILLGAKDRDTLFALAAVGVLQFAPVFVRRIPV
jgi:hypothetical protein